MRPIRMTIETDLPELEEDRKIEVECDDAIVILSKVNGAILGADKNGEPALTREIGVWWGGFREAADFYNRIAQGVLELFMSPEDKRLAQYNIINLMQFLIDKSGLAGKVSVAVSEDFVANAKRAKGRAPAAAEH